MSGVLFVMTLPRTVLSVGGVPGALDAMAALGMDSSRRAETLSVAEFVELARVLS